MPETGNPPIDALSEGVASFLAQVRIEKGQSELTARTERRAGFHRLRFAAVHRQQPRTVPGDVGDVVIGAHRSVDAGLGGGGRR